ncbi:MAG: glycosyltransferase family A protein [Verrucomicrobiales bacterium]
MLNYVIITAARNEEAVIRQPLDSVTRQTFLPQRWVIVDDGSTDRTVEIVKEYQVRFPWIQLLQRPPRGDRSFAGKAHAVNEALKQLSSVDYAIICNLDADVSFDPDYMEFILNQFHSNQKLGVGGTPFTEEGDYDSTRDSFEGENYVAGPCQLFRRECWDEIGGYLPNKAGGVDWIAVMTARMKGWTARAFPEKRFHHHRSMGTAERGVHASSFSYGEKDYYLGNSPVWEVFRIGFRLFKRPIVTGATALLAGYLWAAVRRIPRAVSPELMHFHRCEQMQKLRNILKSLVTFKKVETFGTGSTSTKES